MTDVQADDESLGVAQLPKTNWRLIRARTTRKPRIRLATQRVWRPPLPTPSTPKSSSLPKLKTSLGSEALWLAIEGDAALGAAKANGGVVLTTAPPLH